MASSLPQEEMPIQDRVEMMISDNESHNIQLESQVLTDLETELQQRLSFIFESNRKLSTYEIAVIKDSALINNNLGTTLAFRLSTDQDKEIIGLSETKAKKFLIDTNSMIRNSNYTEEEFKMLDAKRKAGSLSMEDKERYRSLGKVWDAIKDKEEAVQTLVHEWIHVQTPTPVDIQPRGISVAEMFTIHFTQGVAYQDIKAVMDLLKLSIGSDYFNEIMQESLTHEGSFNFFINTLSDLMGKDIVDKILNYLPITYENLKLKDTSVDWLDFNNVASSIIQFINSKVPRHQLNPKIMNVLRKRKDFIGGDLITEDLLESIKGYE